jgi:uroporphyrinogen decarboxylase
MRYNDTFLRACRKQKVDVVPVWYMRQAGRYQPEYREIRRKHSLLEICRHPELCAEVTTLPVRQLGVDAAILFSDIMVPVGAMGVDFAIRSNVGPVIHNPIRSMADVSRLKPVEPEDDLPYVMESIRILSRSLPVPLIGFSGAPFTLASYMVEGGPSRHYLKTKTLMYRSPDIWFALMDKLEQMIVSYLKAQIAAGAHAVQVFDSWVGSLSPEDFREYVMPTMRRIFQKLGETETPVIYFGVGTGELLPMWRELDAHVIGLDWRVPLGEARRRLGSRFALQGNLDPAVLLAPWSEIERRAQAILEEGMAQPGYVFNLGHGVFPEVSVETLQRLTAFVHAYSRSYFSRSSTS